MTHDTISVVAIDPKGKIAAGSSSNGANHKVSVRTGSYQSLAIEIDTGASGFE